jgi:hypothetical protein
MLPGRSNVSVAAPAARADLVVVVLEAAAVDPEREIAIGAEQAAKCDLAVEIRGRHREASGAHPCDLRRCGRWQAACHVATRRDAE